MKTKIKNYYTIVIDKNNQIDFMLLFEALSSKESAASFHSVDYGDRLEVTLKGFSENQVNRIMDYINANN